MQVNRRGLFGAIAAVFGGAGALATTKSDPLAGVAGVGAPLKRMTTGVTSIQQFTSPPAHVFNVSGNAMDAKSFAEYLSANPRAIADAITQALQAGEAEDLKNALRNI